MYFFMKKIVIAFLLALILSACSKDSETSIISQELKNQNVVDDQTTQKSKSIKADFEKDLDGFLKTSTGSSDSGATR